uniref:Pre-hexon-linking protein VIII n=1 Tax=Pipistrellus pipistrellus adenovirus TaxID=3140007 RepID=A0AAU6S547_9ADEN
MSKVIPTPYMWSYQPQSGHAAGASQDYSTRMNWLSAGPSMISRVNGVRALRNDILIRQAAITETPRWIANPPTWPASLLPQNGGPPKVIELPRNESLEVGMTNSGAQLAGGGRVYGPGPSHWGGIRHRALRGSGITLSEDQVSARHLRPDGIFQIAGGGLSSFDPTRQFLTLQASSTQPRSGGIGSVQFVNEFVPSVYLNPFSGPPGTYPDAFIPNYDVVTNSVDGYSG